MLQVNDYLDMARKRQGFKSDSELSTALNLARIAVSTYRTKRAFPSPKVMCQLAKFAGLDRDEALLNLGIWKAEDEDVADSYRHILEKIRRSAAALVAGAVMTAFALLDPAAAAAGTKLEQTAPAAAAAVYYGKFRKWLRTAAESVARTLAPGRALAFQA